MAAGGVSCGVGVPDRMGKLGGMLGYLSCGRPGGVKLRVGSFYWYTFCKATSEVCSQLDMGWWVGEENAVEVLIPTSPACQSVFHVTRSALDAVLAHACALVLPPRPS